MTHATPAGFLSRSVHRNNQDELMRNMARYSKADLIFSSGYRRFKPYESLFKNLGYNIITQTQYKNNSNVIKNTNLPLIGVLKDED